jgi:hypothetical protein
MQETCCCCLGKSSHWTLSPSQLGNPDFFPLPIKLWEMAILAPDHRRHQPFHLATQAERLLLKGIFMVYGSG